MALDSAARTALTHYCYDAHLDLYSDGEPGAIVDRVVFLEGDEPSFGEVERALETEGFVTIEPVSLDGLHLIRLTKGGLDWFAAEVDAERTHTIEREEELREYASDRRADQTHEARLALGYVTDPSC